MIGEIRIAEHYIHSRLIAISLVACNTIFANKFFIVVSHFVRSKTRQKRGHILY